MKVAERSPDGSPDPLRPRKPACVRTHNVNVSSMGLLSDCQTSMVASKNTILALGVAKFVQNTFFFALYYSMYSKPVPASYCDDTWWALGAQSLDCGPLLGIAVVGYLTGVYCESFPLFLVFFVVSATARAHRITLQYMCPSKDRRDACVRRFTPSSVSASTPPSSCALVSSNSCAATAGGSSSPYACVAHPESGRTNPSPRRSSPARRLSPMREFSATRRTATATFSSSRTCSRSGATRPANCIRTASELLPTHLRMAIELPSNCLQVWLYTMYTAMMTGILYLSCGKVLLAALFPPNNSDYNKF